MEMGETMAEEYDNDNDGRATLPVNLRSSIIALLPPKSARWRRRLGWQQWCSNGNTTINLKKTAEAASNSVYKGGSGGRDQEKTGDRRWCTLRHSPHKRWRAMSVDATTGQAVTVEMRDDCNTGDGGGAHQGGYGNGSED